MYSDSSHSPGWLHSLLYSGIVNFFEKVRESFGPKVICNLGLEGGAGVHLVVSKAKR